MPVVRLDIILIGLARRGALPQVPVEVGWYRRYFADANRLAGIAVPALGRVGATDQTIMYLLDDVNVEGRRTALGPHLHELLIFLLRLNEERSLGRIVATGLFYVDVLPSLKSCDGHRSVPVVWRDRK